jgi:glycosyltransferase involved in cell wall biosynthesis
MRVMTQESYDIIYLNAVEPLPIPGGRRFYEFHKPLARKFSILYLQSYSNENEKERIEKILGDAGINVDFIKIPGNRNRSPASFLAFRLRAMRATLAYLKKVANHIRIIHEEASPYPLFTRFFNRSSKHTLLTINELRGSHSVEMLGFVGLGEFIAEKLLRVMPNCYDSIVTVSPSVYGMAERYFRGRNVVLISNALNINKFSPNGKSQKNDDGTLRIITVSRLIRYKVFLLPTVCRILSRIAKSNDLQILYRLIGRGPLEDTMQRFAQNLGSDGVRLELHSNLLADDEYVSFLRESDLYMHLNPYMEGFGYSAAEAMSSGVPVVAFDIPGIHDVVQDKSSGFLVKPMDLRSLYTKLSLVLTDPSLRNEMGANARARMVSEFSIEKRVRQLERLYETYLNA